MRPFEEFVNLPKAEIIRILSQGLGYGLPLDMVKTKTEFVTLRTEHKDYTKFKDLPRGEPYQEHLQLNDDYQLMRFVYYPEHGGSSVRETVLNQVAIFLELQRLGFLPLPTPTHTEAPELPYQVWYGYGDQWPGQLELGQHPFYNHGTFRYARKLYKTLRPYHELKPAHRHYWRYHFVPGTGVVPDSMQELTWPQVIEACEQEVIYQTTTTWTPEGITRQVALSPFNPEA